MFHSLNEFEALYRTEMDATQKVFDAMTDDSLGKRVADGHRTLGRVAWHICTTVPEMMERTGLKLDLVSESTPIPTVAKDIAHVYGAVSRALLEEINNKWSDESLDVEDDMYGQTWPRKSTLLALLQHQTHHRGQMTVLMRQAGIRVPGVYGPAKEDWADYGMPIPEV